MITLSLDAMGGDNGHSIVVDAAAEALKQHSELRLILVGDEALLRSALQGVGLAAHPRLSIRHASQTVGMHELPSKALRQKKDSSMRVAVNLVKSGEADACVSAGNTGALMATAKFVLKTLTGIDRPAIVSAIPSLGGHTHMLDLGANSDCTSEQLFQFAVMGSVMATTIHGIRSPRVGLLNIGEEEIKGTDAIQQAGRLLAAASDLNYIGFVEGDDIFLGEVDVVVCDGFVGNVALKTSEGVAKLVANMLREEFNRSFLTRLSGLAAMPVLRSLKMRMDPRKYNGASLLGLQGIVIKSHGGADAVAFGTAIDMAIVEARQQVPGRISELLATALGETDEMSLAAGDAIEVPELAQNTLTEDLEGAVTPEEPAPPNS